nr:MAG TPA: hypothetical protein [Caudoviricetes sp.]
MILIKFFISQLLNTYQVSIIGLLVSQTLINFK